MRTGSMRVLQRRQDMLRDSIPGSDVPQHSTLGTAVVVRTTGGHQTVARGPMLKKSNGVWIMVVVVDFQTDHTHGFEGREERVHDLWVCTDGARVGERTHAPSVSDQSEGFLRTQGGFGHIAGNEELFKSVLDIRSVASRHQGVRQVGTRQSPTGTVQHALTVERVPSVLHQKRIDALEHLDATLYAVLLGKSQAGL